MRPPSVNAPKNHADFKCLRRKRVVFGTHSIYLVLVNWYVKRKSKSAEKGLGRADSSWRVMGGEALE